MDDRLQVSETRLVLGPLQGSLRAPRRCASGLGRIERFPGKGVCSQLTSDRCWLGRQRDSVPDFPHA